jgi:hypothetical protein
VRPEVLAMPRKPSTSCKDCGSTEGLGWWVGRFKHPGASSARCKPCYLAYERRRQSGDRAGVRLNKVPGPKPVRPPAVCTDCGATFQRVNQRSRCPGCSELHLLVYRTRSEVRRKRTVRRGDRGIDWASVGERDGWLCHLCGDPVPQYAGNSPQAATVDHIVPIARGGEHVWTNVALAHRECNIRRGANL